MIKLILGGVAAIGVLIVGAWAFWRFYWFWRNPKRDVVRGDHVICPADGTVVYVKRVEPHEPVISCKQGVAASINDIVREELDQPKVLIGIFMSPFSVHYNRAPVSGTVEAFKQYPSVGKNLFMGSMHWRTFFRRKPMYAHSGHIVQNNRAVTRIAGLLRGEPIHCYVVQIGGGGVAGIDSFREPGQRVEQGDVFGMIRIGSQVDVVVPYREGMTIRVGEGDRVRAGLSVLID